MLTGDAGCSPTKSATAFFTSGGAILLADMRNLVMSSLSSEPDTSISFMCETSPLSLATLPLSPNTTSSEKFGNMSMNVALSDSGTLYENRPSVTCIVSRPCVPPSGLYT